MVADLKVASIRKGRISEVKLRALMDSTADLVWVKDTQGRYLDCNAQFERFFEVTKSEILGKNDQELFSIEGSGSWRRDAHAETLGAMHQEEIWLTSPSDGYRGIFEKFETPLLDSPGHQIGTLGIARDVSERHKAETSVRDLSRTLNLKSAWHHILLRATTEVALAESVCDLMIKDGGYSMAWIGLVTEDSECSVTPLAASGAVDHLNDVKISWADNEWGRGPTGTAIRENRAISTRNLETDETFLAWRGSPAQFPLRSSIAIPLRGQNGVLGALTLYSPVPDRFATQEVELLIELANDLAYGIVTIRTARERFEADARFRESSEQLREISENIRDVFYLVKPDSSQFLYVSPGYEKLSGQSLEQLYADPMSWSRNIHPEDREAAVQLFLGGMTLGKFDIEYRLLHPDGSTRWIRSHGNPILDHRGQVIRISGVATDVTEAKRSQVEQRRLADRLAATMEMISDAMFTLDLEWRITYLNRAVERQLGRTREDLFGKCFWDEVPDVIGTITEHALREARNSMTSTEFERYYAPLGKWFAARVYPHDEGTVVYFRDVTDAKRVDEAVRRHAMRVQAMSRRLFQVEEEERRRLGRELHDQTGSNLAAMTLSVELLRRRLPSSGEGELAVWFSDFDAILQDTIRNVRTVLTDLRPAALDELGLLAALRHYTRHTLRLTNIALKIDGAEPVPRLEPDVAITLFRVAQEAIANVVKHARASLVTISLLQVSGMLRLAVEDNGKGFSSGTALKSISSLGMTTMQERVEAIGAKLTVFSVLGQGTVVTIDLPAKRVGDGFYFSERAP